MIPVPEDLTYLIGFTDFFEFLLSQLLVFSSIFVRMPFQRHFTIGFLDFVIARAASNSFG